MSESGSVVAVPENHKDALGLVERLDPAIGEATSAVGAMLSELLRRTLRGGVLRIGDEMHGYVSEKLDTVIAERTPDLERIAVEVAEHAARTAATEVATEEVRELEQRTRASDLELAGKITETAGAAEQLARESAAALTAKIEESEQRTQSALQDQVQTLIERSNERSDRLKARFAELNKLIAGLSKQLEGSNKELVRMLKESYAELIQMHHRLEADHRRLADRVVELEKPRGLRALWLRLFGRRKSTPAKQVDAA